MAVNEDTILLFTDCLEDAAMTLYYASINEDVDNTAVTNYNRQKGRLNFYICLLKIVDYFLDDIDLKLIDDEALDKINKSLEKLRNHIEENGLNAEEVRRALLLLDIKGFKNINFSLDLITPDAIAMVCAHLVSAMKEEELTILDPNFGVGNLMFTVCNNVDKNIHLVGIEDHPLLSSVASMKANLMQTYVDIYNEDCLKHTMNECDLVLSDLASFDYEEPLDLELSKKGVKYFPYLVIEHLLSIKKKCKYIYLIDNDFFSKKDCNVFKEMLAKKGRILGLISLPTTMFVDPQFAKSIIVLDNTVDQNQHTDIYQLPSIEKKEDFYKVLTEAKTLMSK